MLLQMKLRLWLLLQRIARAHPMIAATFARIIATIRIVVIFVKMIFRALLRLPPTVTWSVSAKKTKTPASNHSSAEADNVGTTVRIITGKCLIDCLIFA